MIDDENTTTDNTEQTDDDAQPKDTLEDLDVTTDEGAEVKGGVPPKFNP